MILIQNEEVGGVEKSRNKYDLDETEARSSGITFKVTPHTGKREFVSLKSQFWAFRLGVCIIMPFSMEVTIEGGRADHGNEEATYSLSPGAPSRQGAVYFVFLINKRWRAVGVSAGGWRHGLEVK